MSKRLLLALGVLLTSLSVLTLEITVTRIASIVMYYHFSFLAVSLALLGLGIGGIYVFLFSRRLPVEQLGRYATMACLLQAACALLALTVLLSLRLNLSVSWAWLFSPAGAQFLLVIGLLIVPFFFGGIALSLVLRHYSAQVNWLYFADLLGAGLGCLFIILAFDWLGGITSVFLVALLPIAAAAMFALFANDRKLLPLTLTLGVVLIALGTLNAPTQWLRIRFPKGEVETTPVYEKWNAYSRVAVYPPNLLSKNFERWDADKAVPVDRMGIDIDAGAWTSIVHFDGNLDKLAYLRGDIAAVPYRLTPKQNVLIIGSGGGQDVLIALLFGTRRVTAVEMNPIMFTIVNDRFGDFSGHVYQRPEVKAVIDEARSFIRHSPEHYDIIQATLVDTFAASVAGAYALSENYLYTQEAFGDYWDHLNDDGILAMTRWYQEPPAEIFRLTTLALAVMREHNVPNPEKHIVITRQEFRATFLLKKSEFTQVEIAALQAAEEEGAFEVIYTPLAAADSDFKKLLAQPTEFVRAYPANIAAPTDDKPFFFYFVKPSDNPFSTLSGMFQGENEPSTLLATLFVFLLALALLFIFLPLGAFAGAAIKNHWSALIYFACLGLGFILIEIALIQRFILFLGHPIYALAVILFALLFFGGIGSYLSGGFADAIRPRAHAIVLLGLIVLLFIYDTAFPWFISTFIGLDTGARIILTIGLLCPLGLLMGMPFPLGIKSVGMTASVLIPWLWGVNGALSVVGSVFAAIVAINFGLRVTFLIGTLVYALAWIVVLYQNAARRQTTQPVS